MTTLGCLFICALLLSTLPASAARVTTEYLVDRLLSEYIVPHYAALARAAEGEEKAWADFCAKPSPSAYDVAREAYRHTADAWSAVEFIRYGPISENFRVDRISYWPERKNATARGLKVLLDKEGTGDLSPDQFAENSVAVQGLPALERLLFEGSAQDFLDGSARSLRRCAVGEAMAANVATIARDVHRGWTDGPASVEKQLEDSATAKEAAARLATDLLSVFSIIRDMKLEPVLGRDIGSAKPKSAEAWRSGRSAHALAINLSAVLDMTRIIMEGQDEEAAVLVSMIESARAIADGLPPDVGTMAGSEKERQQLVLLFDAVTFARDRALADIPAALGVTVGFNSLDGD
jgi:predicted lipoprotein